MIDNSSLRAAFVPVADGYAVDFVAGRVATSTNRSMTPFTSRAGLSGVLLQSGSNNTHGLYHSFTTSGSSLAVQPPFSVVGMFAGNNTPSTDGTQLFGVINASNASPFAVLGAFVAGSTGNIVYQWNNGSYQETNSGFALPAVPTLVSVIHTGAEVSLWTDTVRRSSTTTNVGSTVTYPSTAYVSIGFWHDPAATHQVVHGWVAVFARALSVADLTFLVNNPTWPVTWNEFNPVVPSRAYVGWGDPM